MIKPETSRKWIMCPYCGKKAIGLYGEDAECSGVYCKCTRGCGKVFKLIIEHGKQIFPNKD